MARGIPYHANNFLILTSDDSRRTSEEEGQHVIRHVVSSCKSVKLEVLARETEGTAVDRRRKGRELATGAKIQGQGALGLSSPVAVWYLMDGYSMVIVSIVVLVLCASENALLSGSHLAVAASNLRSLSYAIGERIAS